MLLMNVDIIDDTVSGPIQQTVVDLSVQYCDSNNDNNLLLLSHL